MIHELDGQPLVLSTQLSATEEVLVLVQHSLNGSLTRLELNQAIHKDQSTISRAINRLYDEKKVRFNAAGDIANTPIGTKQVYEEIIPKVNFNNGKR